MKARKDFTEEQVENECQLMEQLFVTRKMREELLTVLKKHEGHSSRVIANAMSNHGVDENVYHKRSIDGNHCMILGMKGEKIVDEISTEMKKVRKSENNLKHLEKLSASLKEIFRCWYRLMGVMKSVKRQSEQAIAQFKKDTIALNKAIHKYVTDEPVPGTGNTHPQFLKAHLLFDYHIQYSLEKWETLGGFDEQSIESTHPQFNQLLRRYGGTRGRNLKRQVMRQFLMERASFVVELVDEMIRKTSRAKRPNAKKRGAGDTDDIAFTSQQGDENSGEVELTELELKINRNALVVRPGLEKFPRLDASVTACKHCGKRLLKFGEAVHYHEYHSCSILDDVDSTKAERLKVEGVAI
mmetsp:Transcript_41414/g.86931  ORF Transcript_41414/g.86931 Transcript_41414/m.86931 type:complete len:355 (-) Transcript_41414:50-1114(-)